MGVSGFVSGRLESMAAMQVAQAQKPYADAYALSSLVQRADTALWPPQPEQIRDLQLWIEDAYMLVLTLASFVLLFCSVSMASSFPFRAIAQGDPLPSLTFKSISDGSLLAVDTLKGNITARSRYRYVTIKV